MFTSFRSANNNFRFFDKLIKSSPKCGIVHPPLSYKCKCRMYILCFIAVKREKSTAFPSRLFRQNILSEVNEIGQPFNCILCLRCSMMFVPLRFDSQFYFFRKRFYILTALKAIYSFIFNAKFINLLKGCYV